MQIWIMLNKSQITFQIQKAVDFHNSLLLQWGLQYHTLDQQYYYKSHAENNTQTRISLKNWKESLFAQHMQYGPLQIHSNYY